MAKPHRGAADALADSEDSDADEPSAARSPAPAGRRALAASALLLCGAAAATAYVGQGRPAAPGGTGVGFAVSKAAGQGRHFAFMPPTRGVGCTNWQNISLLNRTMASVQDCGQLCSETAGCEGMGYQAGGFEGCAGGGPGTCLLWMGRCEVEDNVCFDNYAVDRSALPGCPSKKPGDKYVVAVLFAGRRELMHILVQYVDELVERCVLDEVHVWDFTRDERDARWIRKVANWERPAWQVMNATKDDWWNPAYHYYGAGAEANFVPRWEGAMDNRTVLVKLDDDIVYMDTSKFDEFTDYVLASQQDQFLVHANIVNNGVCAYYQTQRIPRLSAMHPELLEYPTDEFDELRKKGDPITPGRYGALLRDSAIATDLHLDFLASPGDYAWEDPGIGSCIAFRMPGTESERGQGRFSINLFGVTWSNWAVVDELVAHDFAVNDNPEDEQVLTAGATDVGLKECIYTPFVVSHFSFGPQNIPPEVLLQYEDLQRSQHGSQESSPVEFLV